MCKNDDKEQAWGCCDAEQGQLDVGCFKQDVRLEMFRNPTKTLYLKYMILHVCPG